MTIRISGIRTFFTLVCLLFLGTSRGFSVQGDSSSDKENKKNDYLLIADPQVQINATKAINDMYNFKFQSASAQFKWLKEKYPDHPLPYFLLGLNEWWKIMPNPDVETFDDKFLAYMDSSITMAEKIYEVDSTKVEGAFFLSAAYGFKARLHSDRSDWLKAASYGNKSLNYLEESRSREDLSPELMFGDGMVNYYSVWIRDNYPKLKPLLIFFEKGDKDLGLKQLTEVAHNAFYTRTEAQNFLMTILFNYEHDYRDALMIAEYLHKTFPDNAYFHRQYAMMLYNTGQIVMAKYVCEDILHKIDEEMPGYEQNSGRWASYFLGSIMESGKDYKKAREYYQMTIKFGEEIEAYDTGYFLYAMIGMARIYEREGNAKMAKSYLKQVKKYAKRSQPAHKQAREYLKQL